MMGAEGKDLREYNVCSMWNLIDREISRSNSSRLSSFSASFTPLTFLGISGRVNYGVNNNAYTYTRVHTIESLQLGRGRQERERSKERLHSRAYLIGFLFYSIAINCIPIFGALSKPASQRHPFHSHGAFWVRGSGCLSTVAHRVTILYLARVQEATWVTWGNSCGRGGCA